MPRHTTLTIPAAAPLMTYDTVDLAALLREWIETLDEVRPDPHYTPKSGQPSRAGVIATVDAYQVERLMLELERSGYRLEKLGPKASLAVDLPSTESLLVENERLRALLEDR